MTAPIQDDGLNGCRGIMLAVLFVLVIGGVLWLIL